MINLIHRAVYAALVTCGGCSFAPADPSASAPVRSLEPPPPPIVGGSMALAGNRLIIADADRDQIHLVRTAPLDLLHTFELSPGARPSRIAVGAGKAWVVLTGSGEVATLEIDASEPSLSLRAACPTPRGIAVSNDEIFVACTGGQLVRAPGEDAFETLEAQLPKDVRDVTLASGQLTFTALRGGVLSARAMHEASPEPLWQRTLASLAGEEIAGEVGPYFEPTAAPRTRAVGEITRVLYAAGRTGPPRRAIEGNRYLGRASADPCSTGTFAYALATSVGQNPATIQRLNLGELVVPVDFDTMRAEDSTLVAVVSPTGVGGAPAPLKVFRLSGEVNACHQAAEQYALPGQAVSVAAVGSRWAVQLREPAALWFDGEVLALDETSVRDTGHDLFYLPLANQAACASCHLEGLEDGHSWTSAAGQDARTLSLVGGVSDRLGFSWEATPPDLRQLSRDHFGGAGASLSDEQLDAFIRWLDSLRPPRLLVDEGVAARGHDLFMERCASCHGGDGRSTVATAEVESRRARVPELVGVGSRAPLMRAGCAESLDALLGDDACGTGVHHVEDHEERAMLVEFLRSL